MHFSDRRAFLSRIFPGTVALGLGLPLVGTAAGPVDLSNISVPNWKKPTPTEELYRLSVIGPGELLLETSKLAQGKASNANTLEFAGIEVTEMEAVIGILHALGTPSLERTAQAQALLLTVQKAKKGKDFDQAYMNVQQETHNFLRDLTVEYIYASDHAAANNLPEQQTRLFAKLAVANFKAHALIARRISGELRAPPT